MDAIRKIPAPTDLSELSRAGLQCSLEIAIIFSAAVYIYYVVHYERQCSIPSASKREPR